MFHSYFIVSAFIQNRFSTTHMGATLHRRKFPTNVWVHIIFIFYLIIIIPVTCSFLFHLITRIVCLIFAFYHRQPNIYTTLCGYSNRITTFVISVNMINTMSKIISACHSQIKLFSNTNLIYF